MAQTVTALFDRYEDASVAVRNLETMGIADSDISMVANNAENWHKADQPSNAPADAGVGAGIGAVAGGGAGLLAGLGIMAIPGVGPVVAAGWLVATAAGAVLGCSGRRRDRWYRRRVDHVRSAGKSRPHLR
jgi:hypothetical protein